MGTLLVRYETDVSRRSTCGITLIVDDIIIAISTLSNRHTCTCVRLCARVFASVRVHFYVSVPDNILTIIILLLYYIIAVCKYAAIKYTVQIFR